MNNAESVALVLSLGLLAGCSGSEPPPVGTPADAAQRRFGDVDQARILAEESTGDNWLSHGRTYNEQRFSPLTQIDKSNVGRLGLAWYADFETQRNQQATPLVVDGVIYVTETWDKVHAYDARTGKRLWLYDPQEPGEWLVNTCCDAVNRGVAAWDLVHGARQSGQRLRESADGGGRQDLER